MISWPKCWYLVPGCITGICGGSRSLSSSRYDPKKCTWVHSKSAFGGQSCTLVWYKIEQIEHHVSQKDITHLKKGLSC